MLYNAQGIVPIRESCHAHGQFHISTAACRLVNQTGLRLSYWVEQGGIKGDPYSVDARAESAVLVSPIEKTVILSDSQQQVWLCEVPGQSVLILTPPQNLKQVLPILGGLWLCSSAFSSIVCENNCAKYKL